MLRIRHRWLALAGFVVMLCSLIPMTELGNEQSILWMVVVFSAPFLSGFVIIMLSTGSFASSAWMKSAVVAVFAMVPFAFTGIWGGIACCVAWFVLFADIAIWQAHREFKEERHKTSATR